MDEPVGRGVIISSERWPGLRIACSRAGPPVKNMLLEVVGVRPDHLLPVEDLVACLSLEINAQIQPVVRNHSVEPEDELRYRGSDEGPVTAVKGSFTGDVHKPQVTNPCLR